MKNRVIEAEENLPTINVGTIVQAYGFPMLSGFKGENFYKVVKIEGDKAYFQRCNEIGDLSNIAGEAFPADIKNIQKAIESVETGISSNGLKIWKENKQVLKEETDLIALLATLGVVGGHYALRKYGPYVLGKIINGASNIANKIKYYVNPEKWVKFLKELHRNEIFNKQFIDYIQKAGKDKAFSKLIDKSSNIFEELPEFNKSIDKFIKDNDIPKEDIERLKNDIKNGFRNTIQYQAPKVVARLKSDYPQLTQNLNEMIVSDKTDGRVKQMLNKMKSKYRSLDGINYDTLNKTYLFAFTNKSDADKLEKDFKAAKKANPDKSIGKFEFIRSADYPGDKPPIFIKQFKINETIHERVGTSDVNYNRLLKMYDQGGNFTKKKIAALVLHDPNSSKADIFDRLRDYSYSEIKDIMKDLRVWVKESLNEANMLVYNVSPDACEAFLRKYPKVRTAMTGIARKNTDLVRGYKQFLSFKDKNEKLLGGRAETTKSANFGEKTFYKYDWMGTTGWAEIYQYIDGIKESLNESASTYKDWDEFVNPHYILVTLKNGKKLKISRSNIKGGNAAYHTILKAFNNNNYKITDKVVGAMLDKLRDKDEDGKELGRMGAFVSESVNESASRTAMEIGGLTGMNKDFIQKFVDEHNLDIEKVFQFVKKGKLKDRMDFVTALAGKPGNPYQKKLIKMFGESVNEGKYYVGYNKGRGQGKGVFKDTYSTYKEAQKEVEKIEKMMSGSHNMTAYYVADSKGEMVRETVTEARGPKIIQREFDKVVSEIEATLEVYKKAKGTPKEKPLVAKLKELNDKKKSLAKELEDRISGLYKDAELKMTEIVEAYLYSKGKSLKPGFEKTTLGLDKMLKYAKTFQKFYDDFKRKFKDYPKDSAAINQLKDLWSMYHEEPALAEELEGGASEGMSIEKIAEKHKIDINDLLQQFKKGIRVEMEHTTDTGIAKEITLDHLAEDPMYYEKLNKIGL